MARVPADAEQHEHQHEVLGPYDLVIGAELPVAPLPLGHPGGVELVLVALVVPEHPPERGIERTDADVEPDDPSDHGDGDHHVGTPVGALQHLWDTIQPTNPSTMPATSPVRAFCLR